MLESSRSRPLTLRLGPCVIRYGRFRLHSAEVPFADGRVYPASRYQIILESPGGDEIPVHSILIRGSDLPHFIRPLHIWELRWREGIAIHREYLDYISSPAGQEEISARLAAERLPTTASEIVEHERLKMARDEARYQLVLQALHELEEAHPEITIDLSEEIRDGLISEDPKLSQWLRIRDTDDQT